MRTLVLLSTLLLALPCFAAEPAMTLQTVMAKHAQAMGPVEKVQSRRMRLRVIGMAPFEIPVMIEAARPNLIRKEVTIQGALQISGHDGKQTWKLDPFIPGGDKPAALAPAEAKALLEEAELDGLAALHAAKRIKVVYNGPAVVDGKAVHALGVTNPDGSPATVWLDATSFLEIKRTQQGLVMGAMKPVDILSSDYRSIDGVRVAHRLDIGLAGAKDKMSIAIDAVEMNVKLDPARFARPAVK